jgi:hypothetical protein
MLFSMITTCSSGVVAIQNNQLHAGVGTPCGIQMRSNGSTYITRDGLSCQEGYGAPLLQSDSAHRHDRRILLP